MKYFWSGFCDMSKVAYKWVLWVALIVSVIDLFVQTNISRMMWEITMLMWLIISQMYIISFERGGSKNE